MSSEDAEMRAYYAQGKERDRLDDPAVLLGRLAQHEFFFTTSASCRPWQVRIEDGTGCGPDAQVQSPSSATIRTWSS